MGPLLFSKSGGRVFATFPTSFVEGVEAFHRSNMQQSGLKQATENSKCDFTWMLLSKFEPGTYQLSLELS